MAAPHDDNYKITIFSGSLGWTNERRTNDAALVQLGTVAAVVAVAVAVVSFSTVSVSVVKLVKEHTNTQDTLSLWWLASIREVGASFDNL